MTEPDIEVDARGLWCPLPVLRLAKALAGSVVGTVAHLRATDPAVVEDVAVFCREGGHVLVESSRDADVFSFRVRKGNNPRSSVAS
jgi:tRNA 2-thiouridine synthesizing protein A